MIIQYFPTDKILINGIEIKFGEDRGVVRNKIGENYKGEDEEIDLDDVVIWKRRDIYKNIKATDNYFFLSYDNDNKLRDLHLHRCSLIKMFDILFDFNQDVESIAAQLILHSADWKEQDGSYFFKDLKMVISDQYATGGEGRDLSYFYCSSDVSHLSETFA